MRMFSGVLNWCRMLATERVVAQSAVARVVFQHCQPQPRARCLHEEMGRGTADHGPADHQDIENVSPGVQCASPPTCRIRATRLPSMPSASALPCVLDIEASGFGRSSYPIEVGYVLPDGRAACMLVRPADDWTHWDAGAEKVHGITRSTLAAHGRDAREVALALNSDLAGLTVYCDGWAHDYTWLAALFEEAGMSPAFKLESVGALLDDAHLAHLDEARRDAVAELGLTRHRASNDARALQRAIARVAAS
jgi:hypothetical protein